MPSAKVDVPVIAGMKNKMVKAAQDIRHLPIIVGISRLIEARIATRDMHLTRLDLRQNLPEGIEGPLLGSIYQDDVKTAGHDKPPVTVQLTI